jgi:hypothetical protein
MIQDVVSGPQRSQTPRPVHPRDGSKEPKQHEKAATDEPVFKTPDETAAEDASREMNDTSTTPTEKTKKPRKGIKRWLPHGRKQWIIASSVAIVIIGGSTASWLLTHHTKVVAPTPVKKAVPMIKAPTPIYSDLSGLPITDPSLNSKPVTAVMIENSIDARPQSGLSQAGVVFEALAEGGVTRFMALYQDTAPASVGPIRSARPYYITWELGFDAAYAHVGGSPDGLADITAWNVQDMNQFNYGDSYQRITSREAPHNVYTSISTLNQLETQLGYSSKYTGFPRVDKQTPLAQPTATTINFSMSGPIYNPVFSYDAATNSYNRSTDGTPDTDANTGKQLSPTVVIAMVVPWSQGALDSSGAYYSEYATIGSGTAYVFQNGGVTQGEWQKTGNTSQITFTDSSGKSILLDRGQTWITAVADTSDVTYTPPQTGAAQ